MQNRAPQSPPLGPNERRRVLFVDDEEGIRLTLPTILRMHGFDVTVASTVPDALRHIQHRRFDVLVSDLNIGEAGDGFTLVSAMRRVQPHAVTIIITGYPAFETALRAIRSQVDDYVVKPTRTEDLIATIEEKIKVRKPRRPPLLKPIAAVVQENLAGIQEAWLHRVRQQPDIAALGLNDSQQLDHLPQLLRELVARMQAHNEHLTSESLAAAAQHGFTRRSQGYSIPMMQREGRCLRQTLYQRLQQHILDIDVSGWIPDTLLLNDLLDIFMVESITAYLRVDQGPTSATEPAQTSAAD